MQSRPLPPLRPPGAEPSGAERRCHVRRQPLDGVTCELHRGDRPEPVAVVNLSEGGACLESPTHLEVDDRLTLLLLNRACLGALTAAARVAWCERAGAVYHLGCQFLRPVSPAELLPFLC